MNTIPESARPWLTKLILVTAVKEDVTGPVCDRDNVNPIEYVARFTPAFQGAIERGIQKGELQLPREQVQDVAHLAAEELYEVRRLAELLREGMMAKDFIRPTPLYALYHEYFEESPQVVDLAMRIALYFGTAGGPPDPDHN